MSILNDIRNWFGNKKYKRELLNHDEITSVEDYQADFDIPVTNKIDESTIRRLELEKEFASSVSDENTTSYLVVGNNSDETIPIKWEDVITYKDSEAWKLPKRCYGSRRAESAIQQFIVHWDVCLNSKSCFNILKKRGLSAHFLIDNNGTIIQTMPLDQIGLHAGHRGVNKRSIGVEISNAYYPKYQKWYKKNGFGERPLLTNVKVHSKILDEFMGFYPVQIEALSALMQAMHNRYDIPFETSKHDKFRWGVTEEGTPGFYHHYHVSRNKIDSAGLDLNELLNSLR